MKLFFESAYIVLSIKLIDAASISLRNLLTSQRKGTVRALSGP